MTRLAAVMTRDVARRLVLSAAPMLFAAGATVAGGFTPACYSAGAGTAPPPNAFYFPVGLAVSSGGNALYVVNSDFDLQWNGGTLQSYDLFRVRRDAALLIKENFAAQQDPAAVAQIPFLVPWQPNCLGAPLISQGNGSRLPLGEACSPPTDSTKYEIDSATIGAFATDLQLSMSLPTSPPPGLDPKLAGSWNAQMPRVTTRLFAPVRGDATVTWADVGPDDPTTIPSQDQAADAGVLLTNPNDIFTLKCGVRSDNRCAADHHAGNDPNEPGDTRHLTMPGEPFGMAQTPDDTALAVTHQSSSETSLLTTGIGHPAQGPGSPSMQFVVDNMPTGGDGIAAVSHDRFSSPPPCEVHPGDPTCVFAAFLETNHNTAEIDLLRYYNDDGSTLHRPFLNKEVAYSFAVNAPGTDSRGIAIDPTPRLACEASLSVGPIAADGQPLTTPELQACVQQHPARVFFANRTPPSLVVGEIGEVSTQGDGTYDADALRINANVSLPAGASRVYLAPIVDAAGLYELRVFVVGFDSNTVTVYDPGAGSGPGAIEATIYVGQGPFAMAFDPFDLNDVAQNKKPPPDLRPGAPTPSLYRFAYVASFTGSYMQVIDLDQSQGGGATFENVVFTLGQPTKPKGT